jgi:uncharacterized protein YkwD
LTPPIAASVRLTFAALVAAFVAATVGARASAGPGEWSADLAPVGACADSEDATAPALEKQRAIACLVNWARSRHSRHSLAPSRPLRRAAVLKGRRVASCGQLSHSPCGSDPLAAVRATGFPYSLFGEDLWSGPSGVSARGVVAGWLASPRHRAVMLQRGFRYFGAGLVYAPGFLGNSDGAVWVATFASRR